MRNYSEWEYPDKNREKKWKKISPTFWQVIHYLGEDDQSFLEAKRVIYHPMSLIWVNLILWFLFGSCVDHTKRSSCSNTGYHGVKKWTFSLDPINENKLNNRSLWLRFRWLFWNVCTRSFPASKCMFKNKSWNKWNDRYFSKMCLLSCSISTKPGERNLWLNNFDKKIFLEIVKFFRYHSFTMYAIFFKKLLFLTHW